jgi:hypothetical protein
MPPLDADCDAGDAAHIQKRQLDRSVSWTGRKRLGFVWYRLRLTVREMNYAVRRIVELNARCDNLTGCARRPG